MSMKYVAEPQGLLTLPKGGLLSPEGGNEPEDKNSKARVNTEPSSEVKEQKNGESKGSLVTAPQPNKGKDSTSQNSSDAKKLTGQTPETKKETVAVAKVPSIPKVSLSASINYLKGKIMVEDKYEKGFSTPQEEVCPNNGRDLKVLILITTAPDHEKHRNAIRMTWGHFALRKDIALGFMVGRTSRGDVQSVIDKENERYGDIIEANFVDHYSNLTLKTVAMLEWAKTYCSEAPFVLKTDDDMFINVPLLLAFIHVKKNDKNAMYGRLAKGWKPVRNKKSKYFVDTSTYSRIRYPDFLTGPAYLLTNDVIEKSYNKLLSTVFFFLEDVLVTGFVK
ncbi:Beta-1,3-galactosyltransferase 5 [Armadillidium nasatum]|uniref:Hexosyltransferase n=1 Tax=Armadillidium nasatum TaxID=96803 RepID=A0A5N5TGU0_9CRUS|nr:Beta-1,3-galactosyltransferase 5 [Armadillidium nasatum]